MMPKNKWINSLCFGSAVVLLSLSACKSSKIDTAKSIGKSNPAEPLKDSGDFSETSQDSLGQHILEAESALETTFQSQQRKQHVLEAESAIDGYRESPKRDFDLLDMELDVQFDYQRQAVLGEALLTLKPYARSQQTLILDAKDFEFGGVFFQIEGKEIPINYSYDYEQLTLYLPELMSPSDTFLIRMKYEAFPERNSGSGGAAITDTKGLYFIDPLDTIPGKPRMIWTQGETEFNSKWFPTIDKPNERFTHTIHLTVEESQQSISNGRLVSQQGLGGGMRKDTWRMEIPHAPYLVAIVVGEFDRVEAASGALPLHYYVEKGYGAGAARVFEHTPAMIQYFESLLQVPFPWPKYDQIVVRDFVSGAMENTTASIFMEELRLTEREAIDSDWEYIIAHELFHQWFGDYVTPESWSNLTLNEGFANYSEFLWNEQQHGEAYAQLKLLVEKENYLLEALTKREDLIRFTYEDADELFDSHSYSKGGLILHMLRRYLGDELFFSGLRDYLKKHALQSVEVHDLRIALEQISGEDLNWFFNQWFLDKGHPEVSVEVDYSQSENLLITVQQVQDLEENPLYQLPFRVSWYEQGQRKERDFMLNRAYQQFAVENENPVHQLYFDEGKDLLVVDRSLRASAFYERQFQESHLGIARYEALDSLISRDEQELLRPLLKKGLEDQFWSVRALVLQAIQGHPEWIEEDSELEDLVLKLAEEDEENTVRAGAIDALAAYDADKFFHAFVRLANAPSYLISSAALMGMNQATGAQLTEAMMDRFSEEDSYRIAVPVAEYFLKKDVSGKGDWFRSKVKVLNGEGLYYFLGYFSEYFVVNPEEGKEEAIRYLLDQVEKSSQPFVRLGAFQGLMGFADEEAVVSELSRISRGEQNGQLRQYFEYFLETILGEK